jgi:hypothetical protein
VNVPADIKVGDKITVWKSEGFGGDNVILTVHTVTKLGKLKITLSDGSEWKRRNGYEWYGHDTYWCPHLLPFKEEHHELERRGKAKKVFDHLKEKIDWKGAPVGKLETLVLMMGEVEKEEES